MAVYMGLDDFLGRLVAGLDAAGVPYMVAGSVACALHGEPRSTQVVDIVVDLDAESLRRLLQELPEEHYYVSHDAAREALRRRSQFNVIDMATGWKADLIVLKRRAFSQTEFSRRRPATLLGVEVQVVSAEDVVLTKLEWAQKSGGSERQLRDVRGVLQAPGQRLDETYLQAWAERLEVVDLLDKARGP